MTSGAGISHSEYSVGEEAIPLDALQLWVALPESRGTASPAFERHEPLPRLSLAAVEGAPGEAIVVMGSLGGVQSPATAYTPIVGAELSIPAGSRVRIPLDPTWEHALVGVEGVAVVLTDAEGSVDDAGSGDPAAPGARTGADRAIDLDRQHLLYLGMHRESIEVAAPEGATVFLLGG